MSDILKAYSIQQWLELLPAGVSRGHRLRPRELAVEAAAEQGVERESSEWHGTPLGEASNEDLEAVLADTVLGEFKTRLGRIGLEYQSPSVPA